MGNKNTKQLEQITALARAAFESVATKDRRGVDLAIRSAGYRHVGRMQAKEIAEFFGVTKGRVTQWMREGCPRNQDNSYSLHDVYLWRLEKEVDLRATTKLSELAEGTDAEALVGKGGKYLDAVRKELARKYKRQNDIAENKLLDAAEAQMELSKAASLLRSHHEALINAYPELRKEFGRIIDDMERSMNAVSRNKESEIIEVQNEKMDEG